MDETQIVLPHRIENQVDLYMSPHTAQTAIRILVAEDEPGVRNLLGLALKHQGYSAEFSEDAEDGIQRLREMPGRYAALVIDPTISGGVAELIEEAKAAQPSLAVIMIVDHSSKSVRIPGADETIVKPVTAEAFRNAIQRSLRVPRPFAHPATAEAGAPSSVWRTETQSLVRHVAVSDVPVLIHGETGVGKEMLARQLHALSPRSKKPFLKVNCTALPGELIESELFGYERGAFTGAFKNTPGKFEMAEGGVILLDEIGDMDFKLQAKLLQVLQDFEFMRLGSSEPRRVDVRVIAATHCNLERAISEGRFREDLYYRLNIITLNVPALRDRKDEILPLAYQFMRKHATANMPVVEITGELRECLLTHDWPGNIRELENVIRKLLVIRRADFVADELRRTARRRTESAPVMMTNPWPGTKPTPDVRASESGNATAAAVAPAIPLMASSDMASSDEEPLTGTGTLRVHPAPERTIPFRTLPRPSAPLPMGESEPWSVLERVDKARRDAEIDAIITALNATLWNRRRAAEVLNIDYKALLYKMKKLGIVERATTQVAI